MLNKKLAGLLLIPALAATMNASHAIGGSASQTLTATLASYVDIEPNPVGAVTATTITPATGNLATAFVSKFIVTLNDAAQDIYLQATTASATNPTEVAFFEQGGNTYAILSNTTLGKLPTTAAVADCKVAAPTAADNANAIAYPMATVVVDNGGTATYDNTKNQYTVAANPGMSNLTATSGTVPVANTYSYADTAGTYQAIVTLTATSL